jgi:hypothetical protein
MAIQGETDPPETGSPRTGSDWSVVWMTVLVMGALLGSVLFISSLPSGTSSGNHADFACAVPSAIISLLCWGALAVKAARAGVRWVHAEHARHQAWLAMLPPEEQIVVRAAETAAVAAVLTAGAVHWHRQHEARHAALVTSVLGYDPAAGPSPLRQRMRQGNPPQ